MCGPCLLGHLSVTGENTFVIVVDGWLNEGCLCGIHTIVENHSFVHLYKGTEIQYLNILYLQGALSYG